MGFNRSWTHLATAALAAVSLACGGAEDDSATTEATGASALHSGAFFDGFDSYDSSNMEMANWANGDPFACGFLPDHVTFSGGTMTLKLDNTPSSNKPYSGGEYRTKDVFSYGKFEVKMKPAKASGIVSSFFTYTGSPWDEIDIEFLGKNTYQVQTNYYVNGTGGHEQMIDLGFDASTAYHTYAFEWKSGSITWYVDGVQKRVVSGGTLPSHPMQIMMNLWNGTGVDSWLGSYSYSGPLYASYDSASYSPPGTGGGGGGSTTYALNVSKSGNGSGTVSGGSINCGSTCSANVNQGSSVTLTANPDSGSTFAGWSGPCSGTGTCTVTMNSAQNVTATFNSVTCSSAPSTPSSLSATTASSSQIQLNWNAVSPPSNCSVTYSVFQNGNQIVSGLTSPYYLVGNLAANTTYSFTVRAVDSAGSSSASNSATATTQQVIDTQQPSAPGALYATSVTTSTVSLSWSASTDNVGVVAYDVYLGSTLYVSSASPNATVSNLSSGATYTFTVRARDGAGNVSPSSPSLTVTTVTTVDIIPPSTPSNLTWASDGGTVTMTWTPSTDNVGVSGYQLLYGNFSLGIFSDTVLTLIGFKPGTPYTFTVKALDAAGNVSAASNQITVLLGTSVDTTPPSAPTNLTLSNATSSSLTVRWTASTDDVGVVIYQVLVNGNQVSVASSTSATITGLASGTVYGVSVRALDAAGNVSASSTSLYVTTL